MYGRRVSQSFRLWSNAWQIPWIVAVTAGFPASPSQAAVVATIPPQPRLVLGYVISEDPEEIAPLTIDFNADGVGEVFFKGGGPMIDFFVTEGNRALIVNSPPPNIGGLLGNLPSGSVIGNDGGQIPGHGWYGGFPAAGVAESHGLPANLNAVAFSSVNTHGNAGYFFNASGYFGVEFKIDGNTHYGWVHVTNETMLGHGGYIDAWAYETDPGRAITAGAVPEPGGVWMLAAAVVSLVGRRKR